MQLKLSISVLALCSAVFTRSVRAQTEELKTHNWKLTTPFVVTQLPVGTESERRGPAAGGMLRANFGDGARLIMVYPDPSASESQALSTRLLSTGFHSACDPEISFDATRILFAAKRAPVDDWNIFEMSIDGSNVRQVTSGIGDCRNPGYQATLYTIISDKPWY